MPKIDSFVLGQLQTNCYIISNQKNFSYIIDPADDFVFLSDYMTNHSLVPKGIILTHGHFDHCLAAFALKKIYNIPILASTKDLFLLKLIKKSSGYWTQTDYLTFPILKIDFDLNKTKTFVFDDINIQVIKTPGHTPGSICLYIPESNILFSGDTLFKAAVGRTDLTYSDKNLLMKSLKKLSKLPVNTTIYPGHGPRTFLGQELNYLTNLF
mgnify:CR=1 FL=1